MRNLLSLLMVVFVSVSVRAADMDWSRQSDQAAILIAMAASKESSPKAAPAPEAPLAPATIAFLGSIGLDPESEDVQIAHQDGTISSIFRGKEISHSLESLAKEGSKKGVSNFITSRVFIRKLKADFAGTSIPKVGYDGIYLTKDERMLVTDKLTEGFSPK